LATAARTIAELEKLLSNPKLLEIKFVANSVNEIKTFANNIRLLSQTNLFHAIDEKNQLEISNYLQVFYNLEMLPEINLLIIDHLVKKTMESSQELLNFHQLQLLYNDYIHKGLGGSATTLPASATKRNLASSASNLLSSPGGMAGNPATSGTVTISQLRIAMRELSHIWSSMIYDKATQIVVLQRVLHKKEDPISHEKFLNVLKLKVTGRQKQSDVSYKYLSNGQLLSLYWHRLSLALNDICMEKLKEHPAITSRCYLCLRKSFSEILQTIQNWNDEELQRNLGPGMKFMKALMKGNTGTDSSGDFMMGNQSNSMMKSSNKKNDSSTDNPTLKNFQRVEDLCGFYGSLLWTQDDLLQSSFITQKLKSSSSYVQRKHGSNPLMRRSQPAMPAPAPEVNPLMRRSQSAMPAPAEASAPAAPADGSDKSAEVIAAAVDHPLITGLKPFHDRYMVSVLERMNIPITQMFPELDGYTAAIPSKRDLQTFIKAIQNEFITVIVESDEKIIFSICKEFLKVNHLILSKIANMIINNADSRRVITTGPASTSNTPGGTGGGPALTPGNQNIQFQRSNSQEHNLQLFILLLQLKDSIEKIPHQILKYLDENALLSALLSTNTTKGKSHETSAANEEKSSSKGLPSSDVSLNYFIANSLMMNEIHKTITMAMYQIYDCTTQHLVAQTVDTITDFSLNLLIPLQKESILYLNANQDSASGKHLFGNSNPAAFDCTLTIQSFVRQFPLLIKTFLFNLPKNQLSTSSAGGPGHSQMLLEIAMEEITMRIIQGYLTVASLCKPFNELIKMKIAKDLSSLEELLSSFCNFNSTNLQKSPVLEEYQ
jgi:hypothetical protein